LGYGDSNDRGDNSFEMGNYLPFVQYGTELMVESLHLGKSHTCITFSENSMKCWGINSNGELG